MVWDEWDGCGWVGANRSPERGSRLGVHVHWLFEEEVFCSAEPRKGEGMQYALEDFVIHPWQDAQQR